MKKKLGSGFAKRSTHKSLGNNNKFGFGLIRRISALSFKTKIAIILFAVICFFGLRLFDKENKNAIYQTSVVRKGVFTKSVSASGFVTTANVQEVTTQATGFVKKLYVEDGQKVKRGEIIAEIELDLVGLQRNSAAYSSYYNAQKSVNLANNNYRSTQSSLQVVYDSISGHDTDETLEMKEKRTKAEVANDNAYDATLSAKSQLAAAWLSYSQTSSTITSPVSGTINLSVATGSQISSGTSSDAANRRIATITTGGSPIISVSISEVDARSVQKGQKALIVLDSIDGKTFTGSVVAVDRMGTSTNGVVTYEALIQMDGEESSVLPNMAANVNIVTLIETDVLLVPSESIIIDGDGSMVQVLKDKLPELVQIETGDSNDTHTIVRSGLSEGEEVITSTFDTETEAENTASPFGGFGRSSSTSRTSGSRTGPMIMGGGL